MGKRFFVLKGFFFFLHQQFDQRHLDQLTFRFHSLKSNFEPLKHFVTLTSLIILKLWFTFIEIIK